MLSAYLKYSITIRKKTMTADTLGAVKPTYASLGTRRSDVIYGGGAKVFDGDQSGNVHTYTVTFIFRYIENFDYDCDIVFDGDVYDIKSIEKLRRREGFKVITERREDG